MVENRVVQGREVGEDDLALIRGLLRERPDWHRTRLSRELCDIWDWRDAAGRIKDMACRSLLRKLERAGLIVLPAPAGRAYNHRRGRRRIDAPHSVSPIETDLRELLPLEVVLVRSGGCHGDLFHCFLSRYHYLGYRTDVGENLKYLALDCRGRPLACLLFGSAAWTAGPRDRFIGWDADARRRHLSRLTNNTRFLILPWVRVPNLASHLLSRVVSRLSRDWEGRYGHSIALVETFIDRSRFDGACYRAANWIRLGSTQGRGRNDRAHRCDRPAGHGPSRIKDIYARPLRKDFRRLLLSP